MKMLHCSKRVHPRTCGEYSTTPRRDSARFGSPPPMRGILRVRLFVRLPLRLIPAHAGNTRAMSTGRYFSGAHPRPCGEYLSPSCRYRLSPGSPPHMRGTHGRTLTFAPAWGFTPAHAGNTLAETAISSQNTKNFDSHTLQLLLQRNTADLQHRNTSSPKLTHSDQYTTTYIKRASTALIPRGRNPST